MSYKVTSDSTSAFLASPGENTNIKKYFKLTPRHLFCVCAAEPRKDRLKQVRASENHLHSEIISG